MIRVLLADDDPQVRQGLRDILVSDHDVEVVAEAADGRQAVDLTDLHVPDAVLMDIRMPVADGLTAAAEIRRRRPRQPIIVLTTFGESEYVRAALALGLNGFLLKAGDPRELLVGLRNVARGGACLSGPIAAAVMSDGRELMRRRDDARAAGSALEALPPQEKAVLRLVARGAPNAEIAVELGLSEGTVKSYLNAAFGRLGVRNRVEAALFAWRAGDG